MKLRETKPVLICIDLQLGFLDDDSWGGNRNNKDAEEVCANIIAQWRSHNEKIIHVRHSSKDVKQNFTPAEKDLHLIHYVSQSKMKPF
jgi:nicotinamidase-related amidase